MGVKMKDMFGMMKQVQAMQEKFAAVQAEMEQLEVEGRSGGGMVKVVSNGKHTVKRVQIDPSVMDDREMLEDLLVTALADAHQQAEAATESRMSGATAGMPMPPGFKLPF